MTPAQSHALPPCVTAMVDTDTGPSHIIGVAFNSTSSFRCFSGTVTRISSQTMSAHAAMVGM